MTTETEVPNLKFLDLTSIGNPHKEVGLSKGFEDLAFNLEGGPDKLNFYYQTSSDTDKAAFIKTMSIYLKEKERLDKINRSKEDIRRILNKAWRKEKQVGLDDSGTIRAASKIAPALSSIGVTTNTTTPPPSLSQRGGGLVDYVKRWNQKPITGGGLIDYMNNFDAVTKKDYIKTPQDLETKYTKQDLVQDYDADPVFSQRTMNINSSDKFVFIFCTYIIRVVVLFMIEWSINSHMITTFQECFNAYIVGYISLILVWVLIANISENAYEQNILLNSLFYYISTKHKGATIRIGVHLFIQVALLPLIYIIKYQKTPIEQDSFEQKRALYNAISNVTFLTWLMTTVVALR